MSLAQAAGERPGVSLTVKEAAALLAVSEDTLRRMMRTGRIDWFATGEKYGYRIPAGEVDRLLAAQEQGKTPDNAWLAQARTLRADAARQQAVYLRDSLKAAVRAAEGLIALYAAEAGDDQEAGR